MLCIILCFIEMVVGCTHMSFMALHLMCAHVIMIQSYIEGLSYMPYFTLKIDEKGYLIDEKKTKSWAFAE